jgi:hypothetical protein
MPKTCTCGHDRDEHGNDGMGRCGATKYCRRGGCPRFSPAVAMTCRTVEVYSYHPERRVVTMSECRHTWIVEVRANPPAVGSWLPCPVCASGSRVDWTQEAAS